MMKDNRITPPDKVLNELPDYFLGRLIYFEDTPNENMKWVVYDGRTKVRCISRTAAENCIRQQVATTSKEQISHLMVGHHFLQRAWKAIDRAAQESDINDRLWLERKSVEVRAMGAALDLLISQKMKKESEL